LHINNLKTIIVVEEMYHAPMNLKTTVTFSILFIAALIALLFASGPILENQQAFAANTGNVGHLYQGGVPGYPYFGGYPNYGGYPYITGYGYPYDTGGDHSYDYGYGGYTYYHHHHHHHTH
jgi:hypothetical protein